jgi:hypothetical protein
MLLFTYFGMALVVTMIMRVVELYVARWRSVKG